MKQWQSMFYLFSSVTYPMKLFCLALKLSNSISREYLIYFQIVVKTSISPISNKGGIGTKIGQLVKYRANNPG